MPSTSTGSPRNWPGAASAHVPYSAAVRLPVGAVGLWMTGSATAEPGSGHMLARLNRAAVWVAAPCGWLREAFRAGAPTTTAVT
jgi:hypothetical protein